MQVRRHRHPNFLKNLFSYLTAPSLMSIDSLLNHNLPLPPHQLRHHNPQYPVSQARLHGLLVDRPWELERARELADRALVDPVLVLGLLLGGVPGDGIGCRCSNFCGSGGGGGGGWCGGRGGAGIDVVVFDRGFAVRGGWRLWCTLGRGRLGRSSGGRCVFDLSRSTLQEFPLRPALDDKGVRIHELDIEILLLYAWQLAVQLIRVCGFADVEAGVEDTSCVAALR